MIPSRVQERVRTATRDKAFEWGLGDDWGSPGRWRSRGGSSGKGSRQPAGCEQRHGGVTGFTLRWEAWNSPRVKAMAQGLGDKGEPLGSTERGSKYSDLGFRGWFWQMEGRTEKGGRRQGTCLGQLCWTQRPGDGGWTGGPRVSESAHSWAVFPDWAGTHKGSAWSLLCTPRPTLCSVIWCWTLEFDHGRSNHAAEIGKHLRLYFVFRKARILLSENQLAILEKRKEKVFVLCSLSFPIGSFPKCVCSGGEFWVTWLHERSLGLTIMRRKK